jgi:MFS family permease
MFCLAAGIVGLAWGGVMPQIAPCVAQFFGPRALGALVGAATLSALLAGAFSAYVAGAIFDLTNSYRMALSLAAVAAGFAVLVAYPGKGATSAWRTERLLVPNPNPPVL